MKNDQDTLQAIDGELKCSGCAAVLRFAPGTKSLKCQYCDTTTKIKDDLTQIEEINLEEFLSYQFSQEEKKEIITVKCNGCNAAVTLKPNVTSDSCPFCGVSLVIKNGTSSSILKPKSILPFKVKPAEAQASFKKWIKSLWFAPNELKKYAKSEQTLNGMYIPYWTYDSATRSSYTGQRGTDHTTTNSKGNRKTRTDWHPVSGDVSRNFDDVLVVASKSLPEEYAQALEPWDLKGLVPFDEKFLSGFRTESYQLDVAQGLPIAKDIMEVTIRKDVCRDIGGDHQRINSLATTHQNMTFKHTLLPIWISTYRFHQKPYRFLVNGRTGEVQGERPYSWIKIVLFIISIAIPVAYYVINKEQQ